MVQNVDDLLQSHTARTMLSNSEFIVMLNQAATDRTELARLLNISDLQLSYITNSIGIDSCWIHRAKEVFDSEEGKELLREWGVEGDYIGVGNCILGYRDCEYPPAPERKEGRVFRV